jgi:V8-like Glu-specific endopeptidase
MGYPKPSLLNSGIKTSTGAITADNGYYASQYVVSIDVDGGSSGSPVFDKEGNVIGVISGGYSKSTTIITANFAIKSQYLIDLINKANRRLEHPITYQTTSKIKELPHTDKLDAIAPYVFIIKVEH